MNPAVIAAIPPIISGIGGIFGQSAANRANRREAERNRRFQERMRNTQWQSAVADMEAAGINPAAAIDRGPNAAPSGNVAAKQEDAISPGVSSALQVAQVAAQIKNMHADTLIKGAQRGLIKYQTARERYASLVARDDWKLLYGEPGGKLSLAERKYGAETGLAEATHTNRQLQNQLLRPMASVADAFQVPIQSLAQWASNALQGGLNSSQLARFMRVVGFEADRVQEFLKDVGSTYWEWSPVNQMIRLFSWAQQRLNSGG